MTVSGGGQNFLRRSDFGALIDELREDGHVVLGPKIDQDAIVYDEITSADDLPVGWRDEQAPGRYRLARRADDRLFGYAVPPTAWKRFLFPPRRGRAIASASRGQVRFAALDPPAQATALLGARGCEVAALGVQDRVFQDGPHTDGHYRSARERAFVVAVQCTDPAGTCFCTSMDTGPEVRSGFDLRLTEIDDGFVVEAGTDAGHRLLERLPCAAATDDQAGAARFAVKRARTLIDTENPRVDAVTVAATLATRPNHTRWRDVAERCLACTNCTLVCPTCFCSRDVLVSNLTSADTETERRWDSCFTLGFADVAGGNFRTKVQHRYRQWLTHKFSNWWHQFGTTGCVGCGRCIVWCPVAIDVRDEVEAIAEDTEPAAAEAAAPTTEDEPPWARTQSDHPVPGSAGVDTTGRDIQTRAQPGGGPVERVPAPTTVVGRFRETHDTVTLTVDGAGLRPLPGQFVMAAVPGVGMPPISVSRYEGVAFDLTIRAVGPATSHLCNLRPGDELGITGPFGVGWPLSAATGRNVVVVAGGIGLAPLRPLIDEVLGCRDDFDSVHIYIGARTPEEVIFSREIEEWHRRPDVEATLTVDRAGAQWDGPVGVVTELFHFAHWDGPRTTAFVCGPERMMQATCQALVDRDVPLDSIYLTTERHMECGVGLCGHCQLGPFFVCRDGPIFSARQLAAYLGVEGI